MGRPRAARRLAGPASGGAAIRPNRAQLIVLAGALAAAAAVAVRAALLAGDQSETVAARRSAWGARPCSSGGLTGWAGGAPWGVAALAAAYAGALAVGPSGLDAWAPAVAAGIVVAGEAGAWAAELRTPLRLDRGVVVRPGGRSCSGRRPRRPPSASS